MLDVLVAQVGLQRARVVPLVGQREATGMPQHVRMGLEAQLRLLARALDHAGEPCRAERCPSLRREHEGGLGLLLALQPS